MKSVIATVVTVLLAGCGSESGTDTLDAGPDPDANEQEPSSLEWQFRIPEYSRLALDSSSNVYVAGNYLPEGHFGDVTLPSGRVLFGSVDSAGNPRWHQTYSRVLVSDLSAGADNIVVSGYINGDVNLGADPLVETGDLFGLYHSIDFDGQPQFTRGFGGPGRSWIFGHLQRASGEIVATGAVSGTVTIGSDTLTIPDEDGLNGLLFEAQANGTPTSTQTISGSDEVSGLSLLEATDGSLFLAGYYVEDATVGSDTFTGQGRFQHFLSRVGSDGSYLWTKPIGTNRLDSTDGVYGLAIDRDPADNVVLVGSFDGHVALPDGTAMVAEGFDVFVTKFSGDGEVLFSKHLIRGFGDAATTDVAVGPQGQIAVVGWFRGVTQINDELLELDNQARAYIALLDSDGSLVSLRSFSSEAGPVETPSWPPQTLPSRAQYGPDGSLFVTMTYTGIVDFGGATTLSCTPPDCFEAGVLLKYSP